MNKTAKELIKLGYKQPELRPHLRPVLDEITKTSAPNKLDQRRGNEILRKHKLREIETLIDQSSDYVDAARRSASIVTAYYCPRRDMVLALVQFEAIDKSWGVDPDAGDEWTETQFAEVHLRANGTKMLASDDEPSYWKAPSDCVLLELR